jgi:lipopolysaccharide export system permease protein
MQFLWKYVDDMVGKGVDAKVLFEMFFYAAIYLIPLGLPLAILLASLMTFGNLGEHLELLAIKSAGISLIRIMKPLIIFIFFISGIAFVFQNNILPKAQTKLWTIVLSLKQKSPELEIPVGSFYKEIIGYNIYVRQKDKAGTLYDMMIYNYSRGFDDAEVIVSDSGKIKGSDNKKYLILTLYNGESFGNINYSKSRYNREQIPYRRDKFSLREILIEFDTNFNMADESIMQGRDISKNINELRSFIDSVSVINDSVSRIYAPTMITQTYQNTFKPVYTHHREVRMQQDTVTCRNFELFYKKALPDQKIRLLEEALSKTERVKNDNGIRMSQQSETLRQIRGHQIELHKKFTLSLACLLFFFIGAPLGSIIRKGGLGVPTILSVFLFILYYTIDIFGYKMAKQGVWPIWEGMWLSTFLLLTLGAFFTYKSVNDSVIINLDVWKDYWQRLTGKKEVRVYYRKEVIMVPPDYTKDILSIENWNRSAIQYLAAHKSPAFYVFFRKQNLRDKDLSHLIYTMNEWIDDLRNAKENLIIGKLMDYPIIRPLHIGFINKPAVRLACFIVFPVGIAIYLFTVSRQREINRDLSTTLKVNDDIQKELEKIVSG